jgi:3-hydroxyisobutyrate dehydrogenase-like beta-hydroxyacid dehydrogenase
MNAKAVAVAVIGTGYMGSSLARSLLQAGHRVSAWNRTRAKSEHLAELGAALPPDPLHTVKTADFVVVNLSDYGTTESLLYPGPVADALRGKTLVQLSSGTPANARRLADWARVNGIAYLDGSIMAPPQYIGAPECEILYAGSRQVYEAAEPMLLAMGGSPRHVGEDVGHAAALESALLAACYGYMFGAMQGAAICEGEGISLAAFAGHAKAFARAIAEGAAQAIDRVGSRRFSADAETLTAIDIHSAAIRNILGASEALGIDAGLPAAMASICGRSLEAGDAKADFAALHKVILRR